MTHIFRIVALADPQALPRIVGLFAQRSLIPAHISCDRRGDMLHIEARLDGLDPAMTAIIAAKLDEAVLVAGATWHPAGEAREPGTAPVLRVRAAA